MDFDSFKDAISKLSEVEGGKEFAEYFVKAKQDVNNEAKEYRTELTKVNDRLSKIEPLLERIGTSDVEEATEKLDGDALTIQKLTSQVNEFDLFKTEMTEKLESEAKSKKIAKLETAIIKLGNDFGVTEKEKLEDLLVLTKSRYEMDSQGDFVTTEGKSIADDLKSVVEARPYLGASAIKPGTKIEKPNSQGAKKATEYSDSEMVALYKSDPVTYKAVLAERKTDLLKNVTYV